MASVSVERDIAASPEAVWGLVSDVTRMDEWSPENTGCAWKGPTGPHVGARFHGTNANGKHTWSTDCEVVESEPGRSFAFRVTSGPFRVSTWSYRFDPSGSGCRVTETWTDDRNGLVRWLSKLVSGVSDRTEHNRAGMEQTLANVARVAETPA